MQASVKRYRTSKFVNNAPLVSAGALFFLVLAAIASHLFSSTLLRTTVQVRPDETVELEPVQPSQRRLGAVRVDTRTQLSSNTWATYEIQIFDAQGRLRASAIKQAWRESGTWREGGETGTWSEQDVQGRFDIQGNSLESPQLTIAISVLSHGRTSGDPLSEPVTVQVTVREGVIDGRYLRAGIIGVVVLTVLGFVSLRFSGQKVIDEVVNDSDIGGRSVCGGGDRLVRLTLKIAADETTPRGQGSLQAEVYIKDSLGTVIYERSLPARMAYRTEDGQLEAATGWVTLNLILEPRASYGFYIEVVPDAPVDWTYLKVYDGRRTFNAADVVHLQADT